MTRWRAALLAASVAVGAAMPGSPVAAASGACKVVKIADLPVRVVRNRVVVDGAVNGRAVGVMLDTGATATIIPRPVADRLGLSRQKAPGRRMLGVGGETDVETALVDEFRLGDATAKGRRMMVAGEHDPGDGIAVLLGEDFFRAVDVEFDLAHNAVRLFRPVDCDGTSLAYWAPSGASEVPMEGVGEVAPSIIVPVQLNGRSVRALLDSGASRSVLDRAEATRLGVVAEAPGVPAGKSAGVGPATVDWWVGEVQAFVIGDESIKDTKIRVADLRKGMRYTAPGSSMVQKSIDGATEMLLGVDFLRAHRVFVAHSQQKVYFTYAGGPVFDWADPARSRSDPDRAIADSDAALRSNPQDPEAYFRRANAWYEKKDYDRAIADYDASIRINPGRASVYVNRAGARLAKGDAAGAIADASRAIEIDPKSVQAIVRRGTAKMRGGDPEGAIVDFTRAIEIDPRFAAAYNQLAWVLATAERPAVRDGRRAVESAQKACELSEWKNPAFVDTLAAAYARAGNFEDAVKWQRKAMESPRPASDDQAAARLRLYEERKAWPAD